MINNYFSYYSVTCFKNVIHSPLTARILLVNKVSFFVCLVALPRPHLFNPQSYSVCASKNFKVTQMIRVLRGLWKIVKIVMQSNDQQEWKLGNLINTLRYNLYGKLDHQNRYSQFTHKVEWTYPKYLIESFNKRIVLNFSLLRALCTADSVRLRPVRQILMWQNIEPSKM